jgi:hypothetical protein|tara:strand:+ start:2329 stop:2622 length:294 start_codon:yes stop_codon:yes gene_type:complete
MKIGDVVCQGSRVIKLGNRIRSKRLGVVIDIRDTYLGPPNWKKQAHLQAWSKLLGQAVDVLWDNGHLSENFAENSLEVVTDVEIDDILGFCCTIPLV